MCFGFRKFPYYLSLSDLETPMFVIVWTDLEFPLVEIFATLAKINMSEELLPPFLASWIDSVQVGDWRAGAVHRRLHGVANGIQLWKSGMCKCRDNMGPSLRHGNWPRIRSYPDKSTGKPGSVFFFM